MAVLAVCGSRTWFDKTKLWQALDEWVAKNGKPTELVHGGAVGADTMADEWAKENGVPRHVIVPKYAHRNDRRAPLERNKLIVARATALIAFSHRNSAGTAHTIREARTQGIHPLVITSP